MAKQFGQKKEEVKKKYPSDCGSHKVMIDDNLTKQLLPEHQNLMIICRDDDGAYVTEKFRIDSGLADINRYASAEFRIANVKKYLPEGTNLAPVVVMDIQPESK
jgi:hypothetical protein